MKKPGPAAAFIVPLLFCGSCAFIDLRPIGYECYPQAGAVLSAGDIPVRVSFDTAMDRLETQKAFSVTHPGGNVKGDLRWYGNELSFVPFEPWERGVRYTLTVSGTVYAEDGRELRLSVYVPFYAFSAEGGPYVVSYTPKDGASVSTGEGLRIVFSEPMDRQSASGALQLDGVSGRDLEWLEDDTVLELRPKDPLQPWTVYRWTLGVKARSRSGSSLVKAAGGSFVTDADRLLPAVIELCPLIETSASTWLKTGLPLENGLGPGEAIGVVFNKPMDQSILNCLKFDPPLPGRTERWGSSAVVFIPENDPEPERVYTLVVSKETKDTSGLKPEKELRFTFIPDIPYLTLLSREEGKLSLPEGILKITLRFSLPFTAKAKEDAVSLLRFEPYFPGILKPVSLRSARWWSEDLLELDFEGIEGGAENHYYRLFIPGGRGGLSNGRASYFKEDLSFYVTINGTENA
ncbi:MAG: Ig-like domain-containing protein [Treponema sp.]|jgi:hypothetical protein|nr:Ig-like domain-containing protein [Treponema sp.]